MSTDNPSTDTTRAGVSRDPDAVQRYEITVLGRLPCRWSAWFDGLTVMTREDGSTVIDGPVADQAALHGLLQRLRDLGIPLVAVNRIPPSTPTSDTTSTTERH